MLALILLAALAGLVGGGPVSRSTSSSGAETGITVRLDYPRWSRSRSPESLQITVAAPGANVESISLVLPPSLTDRLEIERIVPEPASASTGPRGVTYTWSVDEWSGSVRVRLDYRSLEAYLQEDEVVITVGDVEQRLTLTQWIFP